MQRTRTIFTQFLCPSKLNSEKLHYEKNQHLEVHADDYSAIICYALLTAVSPKLGRFIHKILTGRTKQ
jgi:hypothetical protein